MNRILILVVLTAALLVAGWFVLNKESTPNSHSTTLGSIARAGQSGRTPAFYIHATENERHHLARSILTQLTSAKAEILGDLRDDLILLSRDPVVFDMIREAYEQRSSLSVYEAMAFADIFAGVRSPHFVEPTRRLFLHEEFRARHKGIYAAKTQASPVLTPHLLELFREMRTMDPIGGSAIAGQLLVAAQVCGGPTLLVLLAEAMEDPRAEVRGSAVILARESRITGLDSRIRALSNDPEQGVRFEVAHALAVIGSRDGVDSLLSMFDAREERLSQMILSIIRQEQFKGVKSKLEEFESKSTGQLQSDVRVTRAALHNKDVLQEMRAVLDNPGAAQVERVEALVGLSAAMEAEDLQRLRERLK
jgi:HEAT repeat protein